MEYKEAFYELKELVSPKEFWENYRSRLAALKPGQYPTLPSLELFLKGLLYSGSIKIKIL